MTEYYKDAFTYFWCLLRYCLAMLPYLTGNYQFEQYVMQANRKTRKTNLEAFKLCVYPDDISMMKALEKQTCSGSLRPPPTIIRGSTYVLTMHVPLP